MPDSHPLPPEEIIIQGIPASPGTVVGKVHIYTKVLPFIGAARIRKEMVPDQIILFKSAQEKLSDKWEALRKKEKKQESKDILSAQMEIIADPDLSEKIEKYIKEDQRTAQQAIINAFENYITLLSESGNKAMKNRMIDLTDIRDGLIEAAGSPNNSVYEMKNDILVTEEISPSEVIQLSHQKVKGFVTEKGGHTSHAAIIARSMGIPAVVGAKELIRQIKEGSTICLKGREGLVIINPSAETREQAKLLSGSPSQSQKEKITICSRPSRTADDYPFTIRANLEFPEELHHVDQFHAEGIGLLRTESMYLDQQEFGSVEKQISFYQKFLQQTDDQPVTIRLFDVGGDKFQGSDIVESNPFLGWRGIRMLLDERRILKRQLKAILTVAGNYACRVKLLIPMVSSVGEITEVKREIETCRQALISEGKEIDGEMPVGMMIEIPSAAIHAPYFAQKVDFFSIGTNDLTQYLLAVDRGNTLISALYDQRHPAVWRLIYHVMKAAEKYDTEVEVCGELASYPVAACCLVGMGISTLSMSPVSIPQAKEMLTERAFGDMEKLAEQVLLCEELEDVKSLFKNWKKSDKNG